MPPRPASCSPLRCLPCAQFTLYHFAGYAYGAAAFLLSKTAGVADKSLVPVAQLALKASLLLPLGLQGL